MVKVSKLLHSTILVQNLSVSVDFYEGLLGLEADSARPNLGFSGKWYKLGEQQLHLMELANCEKADGIQVDRPKHAGRDRHIAFLVDSVEKLAKELTSADVTFTMSRSGRGALFCRDPDGNGLEFIEIN